MKAKIFKTIKIVEIACLAVVYALAAAFLFDYLFLSEGIKDLGILVLFVFGMLVVVWLACVACVVLSGIALWLIASSRVGRPNRGGFALSVIVKLTACVYFFGGMISSAQSGNYFPFLWMLPLIIVFVVSSLTDVIFPKKLFI